MLYQNEKGGKHAPGTIKDLDGLSLDEYHWASYYLYEHGLVYASIAKGRGHTHVWANHIKGRGIDIIEKLIDKSIEHVDENKISFSNKAVTYVEKLLELFVIWSKNPDLQQQAWEFFTDLIK